MKEKIKWFGRYLGCEVWHKEHECKYNIEISYLPHLLGGKLILKELKDITEEDAICWTKLQDDNLSNFGYEFECTDLMIK